MTSADAVNKLEVYSDEQFYGAPNLTEREVYYQVVMFNLYIESIIRERYEECMDNLRDFAEQYEEFDNPFITLDFNFDIENEWVEYVANVAGWTRDDAYSVYRSELCGVSIYDDDDICEFIYDNYDNVDDVCCGDCLVYLHEAGYGSVED